MPIIHTGPDLGANAAEIDERTQAAIGSREDWLAYKEAVRLYWQEIAAYWEEQDVAGLKIFQDALPVGDEVGTTIIKSLAEQGSINYQIIASLIERGARVMQTENPELLKEEYALTQDLLRQKASLDVLQALLRYRQRKDQLLKERDAFIITCIDQGLGAGEKGACFLGAAHQIIAGLPEDIEVITLRDPEEVRTLSQKFTRKK